MTTTSMSVGVWLDHTRAHLVEVKPDGKTSVKTIESGIEPLTRSLGHVPNQPPHGFGGGAGDREHKHTEERRRQQLAAFYTTLIKAVSPYRDIMILGHGAAPEEFAAAVRANPNLVERLRAVEHTDRLTEGELTALVRDRLGAAAERVR